jgi:hypothetical protein
MGKRPEGAVVILSEADAELLIQRLRELAESVYDLLAARTMLLREPSRTRHARVIPHPRPVPTPSAPLDEIF